MSEAPDLLAAISGAISLLRRLGDDPTEIKRHGAAEMCSATAEKLAVALGDSLFTVHAESGIAKSLEGGVLYGVLSRLPGGILLRIIETKTKNGESQ